MFPVWRPELKRPDRGHVGSLCWSGDLNCLSIGLALTDGDEWELRVLAGSRQQVERKTNMCITNKSCLSSWQPQERLKILFCACPSCFFSGKVWKLTVPKAGSVIDVVFTSFVKRDNISLKNQWERGNSSTVFLTSVSAWRPQSCGDG